MQKAMKVAVTLDDFGVLAKQRLESSTGSVLTMTIRGLTSTATRKADGSITLTPMKLADSMLIRRG